MPSIRSPSCPPPPPSNLPPHRLPSRFTFYLQCAFLQCWNLFLRLLAQFTSLQDMSPFPNGPSLFPGSINRARSHGRHLMPPKRGLGSSANLAHHRSDIDCH